jgi:hypothetical protein
VGKYDDEKLREMSYGVWAALTVMQYSEMMAYCMRCASGSLGSSGKCRRHVWLLLKYKMRNKE